MGLFNALEERKITNRTYHYAAPMLTVGMLKQTSLSQLEVAHGQQRRELEAEFELRTARMMQEQDDLRRQVNQGVWRRQYKGNTNMTEQN